MENLLLSHKDLNDFKLVLKQAKVYKVLNETNNIVEYWEKNENNEWINVTEREQLKEKIELAKKKLESLSKKVTK